MFIQTEATTNPATLKFLPGEPVMGEGTANFPRREHAARSPLASYLHEIDGVTGVFLGPDFITVTKADDHDWVQLKPAILGAIMEHFTSGQPVMTEPRADAGNGGGPEGDEPDFEEQEPGSDATPELIDEVKKLIEERVQPAVGRIGGNVEFHSFVGGTVNLRVKGTTGALITQIEATLRHYIPEIEKVQDVMDAIPKPGLETPEGKAIRQLLDERINPQVASHGGYIALVDVKDDTVYIRLEGGCQGCGMADVTLKQGVATEIQALVPSISRVLDVTDHAGGTNPYFQPGKGGASPMM